MKERRLTDLFLRFRDKGDSRALGRVFDAKAPDLLGIALHLTSDSAEAEDIVQATFLAAIENAQRFDGARPLGGWLFGILCKEAARAKRRRTREIEPERLVELKPDSPVERAASRELDDALDVALARCPARYREVLGPLLCDGKKPDEIARSLGRGSGTVRMQIHRGLQHLRRHLPQGLAFSIGAFPTRGLATIKASVFKRAGLAPHTTLPAFSLNALGLLLAMKSTHVVLAVCLVLLPLGVWAVQPSAATGDETDTLVAQAAPVLSMPQAKVEAPAPFEAPPESIARTPVLTSQPKSKAAPVDDATLGIDGIVVDAQSRPVKGAAIYVGTANSLGMPAAVSDGEGRFHLDLEKENEIHLIYARASGYAPSLAQSIRRVDSSPGQVVLKLPGPGSRLEISLSNEAGDPLSGVSILLYEEVREALLPYGGVSQPMVESQLLSDSEGRVICDDLMPGRASVRIRAKGYQPFKKRVFLRAGQTTNAEIRLTRGRTLIGLVVDQEGVTVPDAYISARGSSADHFYRVSTEADQEGRYELHGVGSGTIRAWAHLLQVGSTDQEIPDSLGEVVTWNPVLSTSGPIQGRVVDQRGAPLEAWHVLIHEPDSPHHWWRGVRTDPEGLFRFGETPKWAFHVSVRTPELWNQTSIVLRKDIDAGDRSIEIVVPDDALRSCRLIGRIRYASGAIPPAPSLDYYRNEESTGFSIQADAASGEFHSDPLQPGRYRLRMSDGIMSRVEVREVTLEPRQVLDLGDLVIPDPAMLKVDLQYSNGERRGTPRFNLTLIRGGSQPALSLMNSESDLPSPLLIPPGRLELTVGGSHYHEQTSTFDVISGQEVTQSFLLELGTEIQLEFSPQPGDDLPDLVDITVTNTRDGKTLVLDTIERFGREPFVHRLDLEPGPITIQVRTPDGRESRLTTWWGPQKSRRTYPLPLRIPEER